MNVIDATNALQAKGFVVTEVRGNILGKVKRTDPPAGSKQLPGTQITLFT
jgi:hypothetical protein